MKRLLAGLVLLLSVTVLSFPSNALATCMTNCEAVPTLPDCSTPPTGEWPYGTLFHTTIKCETCCSAPGGPSKCDPEPINLDWIQMWKDGNDMGGVFHELATQCNKITMFDFEPMLVAGSYQLLLSSPQSGNLIMASFDVPTPECTTNTDCADCKTCNSKGTCEDVGLPACTTDADCGEDGQCVVDETNPCNNLCENIVPPCTSDDDCGPCEGCSSSGDCHTMPSLPPECGTDDDCEGDAKCVSDECTAWCESQEPVCTTDEECGSCKVCTDGQCIATGSVPCTETEPCADPTMTCIVDPTDPCQNTCMPSQGEDTGTGSDAGNSTDTGTNTDTGTTTDTSGTNSGSSGGCAHSDHVHIVPILLLGLALIGLAVRRRRRAV